MIKYIKHKTCICNLALSYRCCAEPNMRYMKNEGAERTTLFQYLQYSDQINRTITDQMRDELMLGSNILYTFFIFYGLLFKHIVYVYMYVYVYIPGLIIRLRCGYIVC